MMIRTTLALLFLTFPLIADDRDDSAKTAEFLRKLFVESGGCLAEVPGMKTEAPPKPTLGSTSSAIRAEKYLTGKIQHAGKHAAFVGNCFDKDSGGFAPLPGGKPDVTSTSIGLMAVAEVGTDAKDSVSRAVAYLAKNAKNFEERRIAAGGFEASQQFPEVTKEWIAELQKTANPDGSFGNGPTKARTTGGAIAFILRLGGTLSPDQRKTAVETLRAEQQTDGAFIGADGKTTDLEATYRIMRAFYLLKEKPKNVEKLNEYLRKCRNADGGYGRKPGEKSSGSGTYYVASISKWIKASESKK